MGGKPEWTLSYADAWSHFSKDVLKCAVQGITKINGILDPSLSSQSDISKSKLAAAQSLFFVL